MTYPKTLATAVLAAALMVPAGASAGLQGDGTWKVERGDTLYAVARKLAPGNSSKQAELRRYIVKNSPNAFVNGDPGRMEVGKTLNLPAGSGKVDTDNVGDIELSTMPMPVSKPSPSASAPKAPEVTPDMSFKERVEAKRKAREEAEKKAQLERRQQEMAAEQQRQAEAARRAEAEAARRAAAEKERQRQQRLAAERARQQAAQQRQAAAQQQARPAPAPQASNDVENPYVLCPSLNYNGRCGYWR